ncbi:hypothetical protein TrRE_jg5131, partial [Triparma retinervis]
LSLPSVPHSIVHRLDYATSGLLFVARNPDSQRYMHSLFRSRGLQKEYSALVHGHVGAEGDKGTTTFEAVQDVRHRPWMAVATEGYVEQLEGMEERSEWAEGVLGKLRREGRRGLDNVSEWGIEGHFRVAVGGGTAKVTRVGMRPRTGRTHQLRITAREEWGRGILGDEGYAVGGEAKGVVKEAGGGDEVEINKRWGKAMCLNSRRLRWKHRITGQVVDVSIGDWWEEDLLV